MALGSKTSNAQMLNRVRSAVTDHTAFLNTRSNSQQLRVAATPDDATDNGFGSVLTAVSHPQTAMKFTSGRINGQLYQTETSGASITVDGPQAVLAIDASTGSSAVLESKLSAQYTPGVANAAYFTHVFDTSEAVVNTQQLAGMGNVGAGVYFGLNGPSMGVVRMSEGYPHVCRFDITTGSSTEETIELTLNDVSYTVDVSNAIGDTAFAAYQIATGRNWADDGWYLEAVDNVVDIEGKVAEPRDGAYSISATDIAGNFEYTVSGAVPVENWTYQADWNVDPLDGDGPSGMNLDPAMNNLYKIQMPWLGAADIRHFVSDPSSAQMQLVHRDEFAGSDESTSVSVPDMYLKMKVHSTGGEAPLTTKVASASIVAEGEPIQGLPFSQSFNISNITDFTETPVLSIRNNRINTDGFPNYNNILLRTLSVSSDSNKPIIIRLRLDETLGDETDTDYPKWQSVHDDSCMVYDTNTQTSGLDGREISTLQVGKTGSKVLDLNHMFRMVKGQTLTITAYTTDPTNDITASLIWEEQL